MLGPILFLIYINDMDDATSSDLKSFLYKFADDSKSLRPIECENDRIQMQANIDSLCAWADKWQMEFNSTKCKILHTGRNNPRYSYTMNGYAPAGTVLDPSDMEKDLGVLIHNSLKPSEQCAAAVKKANMVLGQMVRSFTYRHKDTWLNLYRMRVRPHLENCVQA